eukprot:gb/GEZN01003717.1/.p1 GENE.gb/GEZN01003717.1/~~gb/GEZN01003717.1/.p1  ORF type:complete len:582 (-),score=87.15 gb/GEZN01003717.1/:264-2009(-)
MQVTRLCQSSVRSLIDRSHIASIGEALRLHACIHPNKLAAADQFRRLTYAELWARATGLAGRLLQHACPGQHVGFVSSNRLEPLELYAACALAGTVAAPFNPCLGPRELLPLLRNSRPALLFVERSLRGRVDAALQQAELHKHTQVVEIGSFHESEFERWAQPSSQHVALPPEDVHAAWMCLHTSGTTSTPKGALRSQWSMIAGFLTHVELGLCSQDQALLSWPMHGINPAFFAFHLLYLGGSVLPLPLDWYGIDAASASPSQYLQALVDTQASFISLAPAHMLDLLQNDPAIWTTTHPKLKLLLTGARCDPRTKIKIINMIGCGRVWEAYGSTEAGLVTMLQPKDLASGLEGIVGSVGREVSGIPLSRIVLPNGQDTQPGEVGQWVVRTPMMFSGYYNNPIKTQEAFIKDEQGRDWYRTGDLARRQTGHTGEEESGFVELVGRADYVIPLDHGWNLVPEDVESVLLRHQGVAEAVVFPVWRGERCAVPVAIVVLARHTDAVVMSAPSTFSSLVEELYLLLNNNLASFKHPHEIGVCVDPEAIPRSFNRKIQPRQLTKFCENLDQAPLSFQSISWFRKQKL